MQEKTTLNGQLQQIADMLLLNGTLVRCPGLLHGKIGIAIFFFHYAQYTGNELFEEYAMTLIGDIQSQIHNNSPADYERGIAGIGIGINYMMWQGFIAADTGAFEDFDQRMFRAVMCDPWQDFSLYDGVTGYGRYWICRMKDAACRKMALTALEYLLGLIKGNMREFNATESVDVSRFIDDMKVFPIFDLPRVGDSKKQPILLSDNNIKEQDRMGLLHGLAGEGMRLLATMHPGNNQWTELLK